MIKESEGLEQTTKYHLVVGGEGRRGTLFWLHEWESV